MLVRCDSAGGTKDLLNEITARGLQYSVGFAGFLPHLRAAIDTLAEPAWMPAVDADGSIRDGAWVAEITGLLDLHDWPAGMRVIARKERPHPGAQLHPHRRRRAAGDLHGHQRHLTGPARPGSPAPPAGPLRGPDP